MTRLSRRRFVIGSTTGLAGILATRTAPAVGQIKVIGPAVLRPHRLQPHRRPVVTRGKHPGRKYTA